MPCQAAIGSSLGTITIAMGDEHQDSGWAGALSSCARLSWTALHGHWITSGPQDRWKAYNAKAWQSDQGPRSMQVDGS